MQPDLPCIHFFEEIDSTNAYALREFDALEDGAIVAAAAQSAGRGRLGNQWRSSAGKGIYMTLVMKNVSDPLLATAAVSLGTLDAIRHLIPGVSAGIKWPNDIYSGDAKLAGILAEGKVSSKGLEGIVCGVGINVSYTAEELADLNRPVTTLNMLANRKFLSKTLLETFAFFILKRYIILITVSPSLDEWRAENILPGKEVTVIAPTEVVTGTAVGISEAGELLVCTASGVIRSFASADVRIGRL